MRRAEQAAARPPATSSRCSRRSASRSTGAGRPPMKSQHLGPVGGAAQLAARWRRGSGSRRRARRSGWARGRPRCSSRPTMPTVGRRIHRAGRALVVEADVAAGHRRVERAAGVGDAAAGLAELEEDLGLLRVAEVEAVGDAERHARRCRRCSAPPRPRRPCRPRTDRAPRAGCCSPPSRRGRSRVPGTRSTPASPPGPSTVEACTVESYCSYTQRLLAMLGESSSSSSAACRSALAGRSVARPRRRACASSPSRASGS